MMINALADDNKTKKTEEVYGFLWSKSRRTVEGEEWHYYEMRELIREPIVRGRMGIDVGSGSGYDTYLMARDNPSVRIVGMDLSDGVFKAKEVTSGLQNAWIVKGSALDIPAKDDIFDFAYSFGVLHHTADPVRGLREVRRVVKKGAPVFLYLYEDHSENHVKNWALKGVKAVRALSTRLPRRILYVLANLASPFVVFFFSMPSMIFRQFKSTRAVSEKMPFNFGTHPFSVSGDLYDRFSAPIEYRYSRQGARDLLEKNGFVDVKIDRIPAKAGWVVWGYKNQI